MVGGNGRCMVCVELIVFKQLAIEWVRKDVMGYGVDLKNFKEWLELERYTLAGKGIIKDMGRYCLTVEDVKR